MTRPFQCGKFATSSRGRAMADELVDLVGTVPKGTWRAWVSKAEDPEFWRIGGSVLVVAAPAGGQGRPGQPVLRRLRSPPALVKASRSSGRSHRAR